MGKVYFNQMDSRWGSYPYPSANHPAATVRTSGCGTTCGAMIVSSCKEVIYPDAMADISLQNGYRALEGTSDGLFTYISQRWGIEMKRLHSSYEAHQACKEGYYVIIACGRGLWTTGGHYILAVGANNSEIEIYDPYLYNGKFDINGRSGKVRLEGNSAWVQIDTFKANSNAQRFFAFKINNESAPAEPSQNTTRIMYVNTQSANLNVRNAKNGTVIGSLPKGTQVVAYEENDGWTRIGYNKWVASSYLSENAPVTTRKAWVNTQSANLNVRNNKNGSLVGSLPKGTEVTVYEESDGWARIGENRWVSAQYLSYNSVSAVPHTVGQVKRFKEPTTIYENSNLTGKRYGYRANTSVRIMKNISNGVDKIAVIQTGRTGYVRTNCYK